MRKGVEINNFIIKLVYQAVTNTATGDVTYEMYFFYDSYNHLTAIRYVAGTTDHYYYVTTNVQGDVLGIYTAAGVLLASYEYDAWGNCTVTTHNANYIIGDLNPIRYRGYYYDTETGFYLTGTRYYDPEIGRFINADGYVSTGQGVLGNNMFAYCGNNPVNRADPTGMFWKEIGDFFSNAWNGIKTWAKNTFGAGSSTTCTYHSDETEILPNPLPITIKTDTRTSDVISKSGDSTKPISAYSSVDISNKKSSVKVGLKINSEKVIVDASFGTNGLQISSISINGNNENSFGINVNLESMRVEFEHSSAIVWDGSTTGIYTTVGVDVLFFVPLFFKVPVSQTSWKTVPA